MKDHIEDFAIILGIVLLAIIILKLAGPNPKEIQQHYDQCQAVRTPGDCP